MNRNQKIALGCGGAGCLGLIVVVIAGCVIYFVFYNQSRRYSASNYNFNINTNSNSNSNDSNDNSDFNSNANANSNSSSSSSSSLSDDDKHKLYHCAGMTGDGEVVRRVSVKIGLMNEDFTPGANYEQFVKDHFGWAIRNTDFIQSVNTAEKARAYINEHLD